jgi:hypothetical protein
MWVLPVEETGPGCEPISPGFLREPVSAYSSLAFVVAAVVIVVGARRGWLNRWSGRTADGVRAPSVLGYAVLVAGIGFGSIAQHGPNPVWADLAHDLPLLGTLTFIIADAVADLAARPRAWWWWAVPIVALAPLLHLAPHAGDLAQGGVAVVTVAISLERARRRPPLRRPIFFTVVLLGTGGIVEIVSSPGWPLCRAGIPPYGHAVWHVFIAAGLAMLASVMGHRADRDAPVSVR